MSDSAETPAPTLSSAIQRLTATAEAIQAGMSDIGALITLLTPMVIAVDKLHRSAGLALAEAQGEGRATPGMLLYQFKYNVINLIHLEPSLLNDLDVLSGTAAAVQVDSAEQQKWYVVTVGRNPGVFCGSYVFLYFIVYRVT